MSTTLVISVLVAYFGLLILISYFTSRNADSTTFFTGNRQSPWYLVAFGMIGASLSGVTFVSVPGAVINENMAYYQVVLGYVLGYVVIAEVLMPLYYRLNLISIYEYFKTRFGNVSYKTAAAFFVLSRTLGSAMRLYLATDVLQMFLFGPMGVQYWVTAVVTVLLIWIYTFKGGIKTIVYTDTFQTFFLVSAVVICAVVIAQRLDLSFFSLYDRISGMVNANGSLGKIFFLTDYKSRLFFPKQFFGGMFLALTMTGMDQDMMQKNLTCRNLKDAKKNMYSFTAILVVVNLLFLILGGSLYVYAMEKGIALPQNADGSIVTDRVFPTLAFGEFGTIAGVFFLLGITASSYASSDSALAALTTGFCIDFLNFQQRTNEKEKQRLKLLVHIGFSLLFLVIILVVYAIQATTLIGLILKVAAYTYGPLLGLFSFGILTKRMLREVFVPVVSILIPLFCYVLDANADTWLNGYHFGYELLILNGLLTFFGLWLISYKPKKSTEKYENTPG